MVLPSLTTPICAFLALMLLPFRFRLSLQLEILALRHQLTRGVPNQVRKIWLHFASNCPMRHLWPPLLEYLQTTPT